MIGYCKLNGTAGQIERSSDWKHRIETFQEVFPWLLRPILAHCWWVVHVHKVGRIHVLIVNVFLTRILHT